MRHTQTVQAYVKHVDRDPNGSIVIFGTGARVAVHPACDCWMQGDRFGTVVKITRKTIHVKLDRSGRTKRFSPDLLEIAH